MSSFSSSSSFTFAVLVDVVDAEDVDAARMLSTDAEDEDDAGSPKLGEGKGAREGKRVRREPGVWPLKKLSGVARAERLRARMA